MVQLIKSFLLKGEYIQDFTRFSVMKLDFSLDFDASLLASRK
ncbi:MAG: hypothetical protein ACI9LN_004808 [Saprospiraceae bacterium]|jgi:hypothetical protein